MRVRRRDPRHGDRAFDQFGDGAGRAVRGRDDRLSLPDEDAQPEVLALGALELLELAEPAGMADRGALDEDRVGGVGAGRARLRDEVGEEVEHVVLRGHGAAVLRCVGRGQI